MIRTIIITVAALLTFGGIAFAVARPEAADPGPPVLLDAAATSLASPRSAATCGHDADDDRDDADEDEFQVATPRAVEADNRDWDDDGAEADEDGGHDAED